MFSFTIMTPMRFKTTRTKRHGTSAVTGGPAGQSLAQKFKVSRLSMVIRLLDLGLVREVERQ
jgi:hypothetical protein